jgi:hypothetical protein
MRIRNRILLFLIFLCGTIAAQTNLVPNPSFEIYSSCPTSFGEIFKAVNWIDPTSSSSDYFDSCNNGNWGVPLNAGGHQNARTGNGYSGIVTFSPSSITREYIQVKLLDTLEIGKQYCLTFYISFGDTSSYATDRLGAVLSSTPITGTQFNVLNYSPQVENPVNSIITNDSTWQKISGIVNATGNELYLTIGNFYNDANTHFIVADTTYLHSAYYYIDDVSIVELSDCIAGQSISMCLNDFVQLGTSPITEVTYSWQPSIGLSDSTIANPIASPLVTTTYTLTQTQCDVVSTANVTVTVRNDCNTPPSLIIPTTLKTNQTFEIIGLEQNSKLEIFDAIGRLIYVSENYQNDFGGYNIAIGIYVVRFTKPNGEIVKQKLCVIK